MQTFTLLVWEEVPEALNFYLIPDDNLDDEDREVLALVQGCYINSTSTSAEQDDALDCINAALTENPKFLPPRHPQGSKWACRFKDYKREAGPLNVCVSAIVKCGFFL